MFSRLEAKVYPVVASLKGGVTGRPNEISRYMLCRSHTGKWFWQLEISVRTKDRIPVSKVKPPLLQANVSKSIYGLQEFDELVTLSQVEYLMSLEILPESVISDLVASRLKCEIPNEAQAAIGWDGLEDDD